MNRKAVQDAALPEGWRRVKLGELGKFSKGNGITKGEVRDNGVPCIRYGELYTRHNIKVRNFYSFIDAKNLDKRKLIKNNDLLFAGSGETREEIGKCASFNCDIKAYAGSDVIICSINPKKLRADFASCFLNTTGRKQINKLGQGNSIVHIYSKFLRNIGIPLPSLPEQKAIASLLETWDTAIKKTEALIAAKRKRFDALIALLINQKCQKWMHCKVGDLFSIVSKRNTGNKELLSVTQDRGVLPRTMLEGRVMSPSGSTANYKIVEAGNFVISLRSFQGGIEYSRHSGAVSPAYSVLKSKKPICDNFYKHFLKSHVFVRKYLKVAVIGIRDGKQISFPDFESVKLPYPPFHEQQKIATILDVSEKEITLLGQLSEKYRTQKRGLMQKLLTGEWQVEND